MSPARPGDQWNERFSSEHYRYGTTPNDFLAESASLLKPGSEILSIGEGEGRNSVHLATLGHTLTAIDASSVGLEKAQKLAQERGVKLTTQVVDLNDYVIEPNRWDGIVSIFCHLPPPLRRRVHKEIVAGLKPGGMVILEGYTPKQLEHRTGGPPVPELLYTAELLREDFAGLEFRRLEELERDVREGDLHTGRAAVVQLIGVKPSVPTQNR